MIKSLTLITSIILVSTISFLGNAQVQQNNDRKFYSVLFHSPGPEWVDTLSFRDQPGIEKHVNYMATLLEKKKLVLGGPFLDNSGGMVIYDGSVEEATNAAYQDPSVKTRLLTVVVKPWIVVMERK